jgi:O-antigen ligase
LVVLTEAEPLEALRTFLRRLYYALLPLSILLIKYFRSEAVHYGIFNGLPEYVGAATSKNTLGAVCMLSGIFFFWDFLVRFPERRERRTKRILVLDVVFIWMSVYLLRVSSSATSLTCFILGCLLIFFSKRWINERPSFLKAAIPIALCVYVILGYGFGMNDWVATILGRDPTLTGRTNIWNVVLSMGTNPLVGTGYDSFWLGPRLLQIWSLAGGVNQAHNGYLELYLNLGFIGVFILIGLLLSAYRTIAKRLTDVPIIAPFAMTMWTITLFYNMTEAAFKPYFLCLTLLLGLFAMSRGESRTATRPLRVRPQIRPRMTWREANAGRLARNLKPKLD